MSLLRFAALALAGLTMTGCAGLDSGHSAELDAARASFQAVKEDPQVLRSAPKDVIRAGESLGRAERLADYWGCLLYTSPSPRDLSTSRMPSSA